MNLFYIVLFCFGLQAVFPQGSALSATMPDLKELFLDIPAEHLTIVTSKDGKPLSRDERSKLIKLVDQKNGYLEAMGNDDTDIFGGGYLALFKKKDGEWLIGWKFDSNGDGTEHIQFFTKKGSHWTDVTKDVLPNLTRDMVNRRFLEKSKSKDKTKKLTDCASGTYAWKLPRYGTNLEVFVESDCWSGDRLILWKLKFNGSRFEIDK
jgi:hypothetical protein